MAKFNYFDSLEHLSLLTSRLVFLACSTTVSNEEEKESNAISDSSDILLCELEGALFEDFITPLERRDIAECAHSLKRINEVCLQTVSCKNEKNFFGERKNKEAELCIRLMQLVEENIMRLRKIKKPSELPELKAFRTLQREAREVHLSAHKKSASVNLQRNHQILSELYGRLCTTISECFESLIRIMLNNI